MEIGNSARGRSTPQQRLNFLLRSSESLSYRTDLKFSSGCGETTKILSDVQARVMAQVRGMANSHRSTEINNLLFRWLLAHAGDSDHEFHIKRQHHQWNDIIAYYFSAKGHYAELAILEQILLTIKRTRKKVIMTDIIPADRHADRSLATDWICHLDIGHKNPLQLGIQLGTSGKYISKTNSVMKHAQADRKFFGQVSDPVVSQFLRHNTGVFTFPSFNSDPAQRKQSLKHVLAGSREYQWRAIQDPSFNEYGRKVMIILDCLNDEIKKRAIEVRRNVRNLEYVIESPAYNLRVAIKYIEKEPVAVIDFFDNKTQSSEGKNRPIIFALPIGGDFLDFYRDMAGVRAQ